MGKKGKKEKNNDQEYVRETQLAAVVLADSFQTKLRPISFEMPKVLMPVVNVPMLDYTLECLSCNNVEVIYLLCCAHAALIEEYVQNSTWTKPGSNMQVQVILSADSHCAGDALRHLDRLQLIEDDFILISGDVVSNIKIAKALKEHKDRTKLDKRNIMTIVMKKAAQNHRTRALDDDTVVCLSQATQQLLFYDNDVEEDMVCLDRTLADEHDNVEFRYDLMDTHIDICSPELLMLFTDNFDWQTIREDAVVSILGSEILGNKIYAHEIYGSYAARLMDFRTYDSISKDVINRWIFPLVPDNNLLGGPMNSSYSFNRHNIYKEDNVFLSRSCQIGEDTVIGSRTKIADNSKVTTSVIGRDCTIGANCDIKDSYIWGDVVIEEGVSIQGSIVCNRAIIRAGATLKPGSVVSFGVVIGNGFTLQDYRLVTTVQEKVGWDSDDGSDVNDTPVPTDVDAVGESGKGITYFQKELSIEVGRRSVPYKLINTVAPSDEALMLSVHSDDDIVSDFEDPETEDESEAEEGEGEGVAMDSVMDNPVKFYHDVEDYLRGVDQEKKDLDGVIVEMMSLKLSRHATVLDYGTACLMAWLAMSAEASAAPGEGRLKPTKSFVGELVRLLKSWHLVVLKLANRKTEQLQLLLGLERTCLSQDMRFANMFPVGLQQLYDLDVFGEEAIQEWEDMRKDELEGAGELLRLSAPFLAWLREADEDDSDSDEGDEES